MERTVGFGEGCEKDIKYAERVLGYVQKGQFSISKPKPKTKKKVKKKGFNTDV